MNSTRCKRIGSSLLALALTFLLQTPALAASAGEMDDPITVRQWAAMLCGAYLDTPSESGCVSEAYRRGWLPVTAVAAPESGLCRGALYQSVFAAAGLHIYDSTLYPGGKALSAYENCLRVGAELSLCPAGTEPMELVTRDEAAALLELLLTRELHIREPPMLTEFPIQNPNEVNLNDYLLELRRIPEPILRAFADSGWTYAVDFRHLASLSRRYGKSCTGAADYDGKHIYISAIPVRAQLLLRGGGRCGLRLSAYLCRDKLQGIFRGLLCLLHRQPRQCGKGGADGAPDAGDLRVFLRAGGGWLEDPE